MHTPQNSVNIPAFDDKLFAVIQFQGLQHKVMKNDLVMTEKVDMEVGEMFLFDKVLLIGTDQYTSLGRPYVSTAKVLACVEEKSKSEKIIIFKKRRRKGYQKNQGHRQNITLIRILKIYHNPNDKILNNYSSLI